MSEGLWIGDDNIKRLSGPVSMHYLRPTKLTYDRKNRNEYKDNAPLIMLLGDVHFSRQGMCEDCKAPSCYAIDDIEFFKRLDELSTREHPIDFYLESFRFSSEIDPSKGPMLSLFTRKNPEPVWCMDRDPRCPTRTMRWHGGDLRQASVYVKYLNLFDSPNPPEYLKSRQADIEHYFNKKYVEPMLQTCVTFINILIKNPRLTYGEYFDNELKNVLPHIDIEFLEKILDMMYRYSYSLDEWGGGLFDLVMSSSSKSLVKKQMDKMKNFDKNDKDKYREIIVEIYQKNEIIKNILTHGPDYIKNALNNFILVLKKEHPNKYYFSTGYGEESLKILEDFLVHFMAFLVELYTIGRILKPTSDHPSVFSVVYLGNKHIKNIMNILTGLGLYEVVLSVDDDISNVSEVYNPDNNTIKRCIHFPQKIDLKQEIEEHIQHIQRVEDKDNHNFGKKNKIYNKMKDKILKKGETYTFLAHDFDSNKKALFKGIVLTVAQDRDIFEYLVYVNKPMPKFIEDQLEDNGCVFMSKTKYSSPDKPVGHVPNFYDFYINDFEVTAKLVNNKKSARKSVRKSKKSVRKVKKSVRKVKKSVRKSRKSKKSVRKSRKVKKSVRKSRKVKK